MGADYNFHLSDKAKKINRNKYRLLGITDEKTINKLVELDELYFTFMFYHRTEFRENLNKSEEDLEDSE